MPGKGGNNGNRTYQDKEKPAQIRESNITSAKGECKHRPYLQDDDLECSFCYNLLCFKMIQTSCVYI